MVRQDFGETTRGVCGDQSISRVVSFNALVESTLVNVRAEGADRPDSVAFDGL